MVSPCLNIGWKEEQVYNAIFKVLFCFVFRVHVCVCLCEFMCIECQWRPEEGVRSPETGVTWRCEPLCERWQLKYSPLQEKALWAAELSLQPFFFFWIKTPTALCFYFYFTKYNQKFKMSFVIPWDKERQDNSDLTSNVWVGGQKWWLMLKLVMILVHS